MGLSNLNSGPGMCIPASQKVLEEIFSGQEMVIIKDVHIAIMQRRPIHVEAKDADRSSTVLSGEVCCRIISASWLYRKA